MKSTPAPGVIVEVDAAKACAGGKQALASQRHSHASTSHAKLGGPLLLWLRCTTESN